MTPYMNYLLIIAFFFIISTRDFRVLHSGIRVGRYIRPGFCNIDCSLVCDMCVNIIKRLFLQMFVCWCAEI